MKFYLLLLTLVLFNVSFAQNLRRQANRSLAHLSTDTLPSNTTETTPLTDGSTTDQSSGSGLDGWTPVDLTQAHDDPVFMSAFDFGLSYVLSQGIEAGLLQDSTYNVSQVLNIYQQAVNGLNYMVDCQLTPDGSDVVVNVTFTTYYNADTKSRDIGDFYYAFPYLTEDNILEDFQVNYTNQTGVFTINVIPLANLNETSQVSSDSLNPQTYQLDLTGYLGLGGYNRIDVSEINRNQMLSNYLMFGAQYIMDQGISAGYLTAGTSYNLMQVFNIYGEENTDSTIFFFRFEILIDNGAGSSAVVNYEVHYDSSASQPDVTTYGFKSIMNV